jgi:hypothetical protein
LAAARHAEFSKEKASDLYRRWPIVFNRDFNFRADQWLADKPLWFYLYRTNPGRRARFGMNRFLMSPRSLFCDENSDFARRIR